MNQSEPQGDAPVQLKKACICCYGDTIEPETEMLFDKIKADGWAIFRRPGGANIDISRSIAVCEALSHGANRILMVDSDMVIQPEQIRVLEKAMDEHNYTVVSALASRRGCKTPATSAYSRPVDYVGDIVPVNTGLGAACLMVDVQVFADMERVHRIQLVASQGTRFLPFFEKVKFWFNKKNEFGGIVNPDSANDEILEADDDWTQYWASEDQSFTIRAKLAGHPAYVHTGVQIGHKVKEVQWPDWRLQCPGHTGKKRLVVPVGGRPKGNQLQQQSDPQSQEKFGEGWSADVDKQILKDYQTIVKEQSSSQ